jgi:hypothetical protein
MSARRRAADHGFVLNLSIPKTDKPIAIALPANEATLRIDPESEPIFDLDCGSFKLKLNSNFFVKPRRHALLRDEEK